MKDTMERALEIAHAQGGMVFAGSGNVIKGCRYTVHSATLRALESRGLLKSQLYCDGGAMFVVVCKCQDASAS